MVFLCSIWRGSWQWPAFHSPTISSGASTTGCSCASLWEMTSCPTYRLLRSGTRTQTAFILLSFLCVLLSILTVHCVCVTQRGRHRSTGWHLQRRCAQNWGDYLCLYIHAVLDGAKHLIHSISIWSYRKFENSEFFCIYIFKNAF